jgi:hypothetical protein
VEEKRMHSRLLRTPFRVLILALVVTMPAVLFSQVAPAAKGPTQNDSRWDIFGGYSYLYLPPSTEVNGHQFQSNDFGLIGTVDRYFNKNIGLEWSMDTHPRTEGHNDGMWGGQTGLIYRAPAGSYTPFIHGGFGFQHVGGPYQQGNIGALFSVGGGVDFRINQFVSWRFIQADYQYSHVNFGVNGHGNFNEYRLSDGLVFHFGSVEPPPPVTLTCAASTTAAIFPGDPMSITATAGSLNPKDSASYTWSGTGVTGNGNTATVATGSLAPGNYTVKATIVEWAAASEPETLPPAQQASPSGNTSRRHSVARLTRPPSSPTTQAPLLPWPSARRIVRSPTLTRRLPAPSPAAVPPPPTTPPARPLAQSASLAVSATTRDTPSRPKPA